MFDPIVDIEDVKNYNVKIITMPEDNKYDFIVIAVSHQRFKEIGIKKLERCKRYELGDGLKNTFPNNQVDYTHNIKN